MDGCLYPSKSLDPVICFNASNPSSSRRFTIKGSIGPICARVNYWRCFQEDPPLFEAISRGLIEIPLNPSNSYSLKESIAVTELEKGMFSGSRIEDIIMSFMDKRIELYVLSYVHQSADSSYGLAKVPEPAERKLIDGIRLRAIHSKASRVFVWSDQTIKGRVPRDQWLNVGLYAYAVLPGIILAAPTYTSRLWPLIEFTLLESCLGYYIDFSASREYDNFNEETIYSLFGRNVEMFSEGEHLSFSCEGFGNTPREGMCIMVRRFLTTKLGNMETNFENDRTALRDVAVGLLKSGAACSIGHYLICPETCKDRKRGNLTAFLGGISSRGMPPFLKPNAEATFDQISPLWHSSTFTGICTSSRMKASLNVFDTKTGFINNISNMVKYSANRSLLNVKNKSGLSRKMYQMSTKFKFASAAGFKGNLHVFWTSSIMTKRELVTLLTTRKTYWNVPSILAWIELEGSSNGCVPAAGSSMMLDQLSTSELDCLIRVNRRFWGDKAVDKSQISNLASSASPIYDLILDLIGQEIERHQMIPCVASRNMELFLKSVKWRSPYEAVEKRTGKLKLSLFRSYSENSDKTAFEQDSYKLCGDYWICLGNEKAQEVIGMGGRICMSAALAGVGTKDVLDFLRREGLFSEGGIEEYRGIGKRQSYRRWKYMRKPTGIWNRFQGDLNILRNKVVEWQQLPRYALIGGETVQDMYQVPD